jgi:hypothetical protein
MSSLTKAEQARINGAKSRGPKTDEGKRKSSMNACKHGLTSSLIVHQNEDDEEFQRLLAVFIDKFQPADPVEHDLVFEAAAARYQLRRAWALETATFDWQMEKQRKSVDNQVENCDEETRTAIAFESLADDSNSLALLNRYHARIRRGFEKAIRDLEHLRSSRTLTQPKLPNEPKAAPRRPLPVAINAPREGVRNEPTATPAISVIEPSGDLQLQLARQNNTQDLQQLGFKGGRNSEQRVL